MRFSSNRQRLDLQVFLPTRRSSAGVDFSRLVREQGNAYEPLPTRRLAHSNSADYHIEAGRTRLFCQRTFHGQGEFHASRPSEIRIGDSLIMISSGDGVREPMPAIAANRASVRRSGALQVLKFVTEETEAWLGYWLSGPRIPLCCRPGGHACGPSLGSIRNS